MVCSSVAKMKTTSWIPKRGMRVSVALASLKQGKGTPLAASADGLGQRRGQRRAHRSPQGGCLMTCRMEERGGGARGGGEAPGTRSGRTPNQHPSLPAHRSL